VGSALTDGAALGAAAPGVREYARTLTLARWHSSSEWVALDTIVGRESSWQPCAVYPRRLDCGYTGSNSCGIPQRNPCPVSWSGRLYGTRYAQVRWLIVYVAGRYGTPSAALAYWNRHESY